MSGCQHSSVCDPGQQKGLNQQCLSAQSISGPRGRGVKMHCDEPIIKVAIRLHRSVLSELVIVDFWGQNPP